MLIKKILLLLFVTTTTMSYGAEKASIEISLRKTPDSIIYIASPIKGITLGFTDTLYVTEGKKVKLQLEINDLSSVYLQHGEIFYNAIVEPGKNYSVCFDYGADPIVQISDSVQMLRNRVFRDKNFYQYEFVRDYKVAPLDTVGAKMRTNFDSLLTADKKQFEKVKMSQAMRMFIEQDLELYWMGAMSKVIRANFNDCSCNEKQMYDDYMKEWSKIYKDYPLTTQMVPSLYFTSYIEMASTFKSAANGKVLHFKTAQEYYDHLFNNVQLIKNQKIKQAFWAKTLFMAALNNKRFEKILKKYINEFLTTYPNEGFEASFIPFIKKIDDFHAKVNSNFNKNVSFIENGDSIKTLQELLVKFKGKPILVDFWFSTCGPCVSNFQRFGKDLEKFTVQNDITLLCVSIDKEQEQWHTAIKYYKIGGKHIKACQSLHEDIYKTHNVHIFPHYMLVGSDGKILINRLKDLSEHDNFYNQIYDALAKEE